MEKTLEKEQIKLKPSTRMYIRKTKVTKEIRKHTNKRKVTMTQRWLFEKKKKLTEKKLL